MLAMRRVNRELAAKTAELTARMEQHAGRLHELDPADLDRLKRQLDLYLMIFERLGPDLDEKTDLA